MRGVDSTAAASLCVYFDRESYSDLFDWFGYLRLAKSAIIEDRMTCQSI